MTTDTMEDTKFEAAQEGADATFAKESAEAEQPRDLPETAGEGKPAPDAKQGDGASEGVKTPPEDASEDETQYSERAQKRFRELARRNRELQKQLETFKQGETETLKRELADLKASLTKKDVPEEEKYLGELEEHLYAKFKERLAGEEKARGEAASQMDRQIAEEVEDLVADFPEFTGDAVRQTLEYALKYKTPTLREAFEVVQDIARAKEAAKQEVLKSEPRKRAASMLQGGSGVPASAGYTSADVKKKSFSDLVDEAKESMGL